MAHNTRFIPRGTAESAAMVANVRRSAEICARMNRLTFNEPDEVRALLAELTGRAVDDSVLLIPPLYSTSGRDLHLGRRVFINQNCTIYDEGGVEICDDVMIGPNVSLITSGHPLEPARRREGVTCAPIVIGRGVWVGAGAIIIGGVSVGENAVVAAGSVLTKDVPADVLVGGNPAAVIRCLIH